jgi:outer membrane protein assembly factor BamB
VYHGDAAGLGVSTVLAAVNTKRPAWTSPSLDGQLYGEPLVFDGRVYVATEEDVVYALSSSNGRVLWSRHLARAVPSSALPCGDISPVVGITGTPVIDPARSEIFVVADEFVGGAPQHKLVGLNTSSGASNSTSGSIRRALIPRRNFSARGSTSTRVTWCSRWVATTETARRIEVA